MTADFVAESAETLAEALAAHEDSGISSVVDERQQRIEGHRAWSPDSPEAVAMHSCDNPPCVNPSHLSWGSQSVNIADSWARTRRKVKP